METQKMPVTHYENAKQVMDALVEQSTRMITLANELIATQPHLGFTAYIIASDMVSAEQANVSVLNGESPESVINRVGSYARFDWAYKNLPRPLLLKMLPELWTGSDPDDTCPEYLQLWKDAFVANKDRIIFDDKSVRLPAVSTIYRGQLKDASVGISWSLDINVAKKFARTGGLRHMINNGMILKAKVNRKHVLAYLRGRGEQEIIVDPKNALLIED
jgi:hypothetical protein